MDINSLYFRHQLLLMRISANHCRTAMDRDRCEADGIARRIIGFQNGVGAGAAGGWQDSLAL